MAGMNALTGPNNRGYVQANGRLQRWNSRGLRPQGWVEAAARRAARRAWHGRPNNRGLSRQTAGGAL